MKILLGVDDSKYAPHLVKAIASQFRSDDTDVMVLHVLQPMGPPPPQMGNGYAPELAEDSKLAQELVQRTASDLRCAGFKAETTVGVGDVREGIIDSADGWNADLIVLGSHGQRGIQRFLLGGVSEFVARHAHCSVEIVRAPKTA
jgi:nucleotide-binding universal stress UspA family protein